MHCLSNEDGKRIGMTYQRKQRNGFIRTYIFMLINQTVEGKTLKDIATADYGKPNRNTSRYAKGKTRI